MRSIGVTATVAPTARSALAFGTAAVRTLVASGTCGLGTAATAKLT